MNDWSQAPFDDALIFGDEHIILNGHSIVHRDNYVFNKDAILDQLAKNYCGQHILVKLHDGLNLKFSGLEYFLKHCCDNVGIPYNKVTFETINLDVDPVFGLQPMWQETFKHALENISMPDRNLHEAKFIGYTISRMTIARLRLAYELDKAFANDSYCEFGNSYANNNEYMERFYFDLPQNVRLKNHYRDEIEWFRTKEFTPSHLSHLSPPVGWQESYREYDRIWNRFQIEVIPETDVMSSYYFTEKTARCLVTGKPFVLISGINSLARLRDLGFKTYGAVLDESYDSAKNPYKRIQMAIQALSNLYHSPERHILLAQMYQTAEENMSIYREKYKTT